MLALTMVVLLFIIGLGLLKLGSSARMQAVRAVAGISARAAADAGLTQARCLMNKKLLQEEPDWDALPAETATPLPNSYAKYSFDVTGDANSGFLVTSTGRSGIASKTVRGIFVVKSAWFGISVYQTVDIKVGATFATVPANSEFTIQTNSIERGAISLKSGVVIPGNVVVGPGGDPDEVINLGPDAAIEGGTYAAGEEFVFRTVYPPDDLVDWGIKMKVKGETKTIGAESGYYRSGIYTGLRMIETASPGRIEIIDPNVVLYFTGDADIGTKCEFVVRDGASLTLYLGGDFRAGQDSKILNENVTDGSDEAIEAGATSFKIYGTDSCTLVRLSNSSDFYGAIYSPNADLVVNNDGDLFGAFVGKSMTMMNSGGYYYYVEELAKVGIDDPTAYLGIEYWWEE